MPRATRTRSRVQSFDDGDKVNDLEGGLGHVDERVSSEEIAFAVEAVKRAISLRKNAAATRPAQPQWDPHSDG
jgi:hypothetical protein